MPAINISISKRELKEITAFCNERGINLSRFFREKAMESINRAYVAEKSLKKAYDFPKWPKDNVDFSKCPLALWLKTVGKQL